MNPFLLKGYSSPKYFCNRESTKNKLINAINNQQDITLFSIRRMGKSALIHHLFYHLEENFDCIFADIWGTTSLNEFTRTLANAVVKSTLFSKRSITKKLSDFIKTLGASLSIGGDGRPSIELIYNDRNQAFKNLDDIFYFLNHHKKPIIIAIDEFQEIKKYSDNTSLEAKLRTITQQCQNIRFIYSGSEHHLLNEIFTDLNKPFYQSTRMMELKKIPADKYRSFILHHFTNGKKKINEAIINHILQITYQHTYYVQALCNFLYSQSKIPNSISDFDKIYKEYIAEKSVFYDEIPQKFTIPQFNTIKAFGQIGQLRSPTSSDFLKKANAKGASSMQRIIKTLLEKQVIIKEKGNYRLYDVFLEHYLKFNL